MPFLNIVELQWTVLMFLAITPPHTHVHTRRQMQQILEDNSEVGPGEEHLAALTATDRSSWAKTREQFFLKGVNGESMQAIEKVLCVLVQYMSKEVMLSS